MASKLAAKHVVIVGRTSGIGLATALIALDDGATFTIADISSDHLRKVVVELRNEDKVKTRETDINDSDAVASLFAVISTSLWQQASWIVAILLS